MALKKFTVLAIVRRPLMIPPLGRQYLAVVECICRHRQTVLVLISTLLFEGKGNCAVSTFHCSGVEVSIVEKMTFTAWPTCRLCQRFVANQRTYRP
jgi:hypothetical protein